MVSPSTARAEDLAPPAVGILLLVHRVLDVGPEPRPPASAVELVAVLVQRSAAS